AVSGRTAVVVFLALVTLVIALAGFTVYRVVQVAPAVVADLAARIPTPTPSPTPTPRPPALSGVVTAEGAKPVSGATVRAYQGSALVAASITDANGRYGLNLSAGAYRIGFVPGDASGWAGAPDVSVSGGRGLGALARLPAPGYSLAGTIKKSQSTLPVSVFFYRGGDVPCCDLVAAVTDNSLGLYALSLVPGTYRV